MSDFSLLRLQEDIGADLIQKMNEGALSRSDVAIISRTVLDICILYEHPSDFGALLDSLYQMFPALCDLILRYKADYSQQVDLASIHTIQENISNIINHERRTPVWVQDGQ